MWDRGSRTSTGIMLTTLMLRGQLFRHAALEQDLAFQTLRGEPEERPAEITVISNQLAELAIGVGDVQMRRGLAQGQGVARRLLSPGGGAWPAADGRQNGGVVHAPIKLTQQLQVPNH